MIDASGIKVEIPLASANVTPPRFVIPASKVSNAL